MPRCLVGLGANLGDRKTMLHRAVAAIDGIAGIRVTAHSSVLETQAVGGPKDQGVYLNAAIVLETDATASMLLHRLLTIERNLGREPSSRWGPRTIDIDLLLHGQTVIESEELTVPHPWMAIRRFVLQPAVEIAASMRHPQIGWTIRQLWEHLDQGAPCLAVVGCDEQLVSQAVQAARSRGAGHTLWIPDLASWVDTLSIESEAALLGTRAGASDVRSMVLHGQPAVGNFWFNQGLATIPRCPAKTARQSLTDQVEDGQPRHASPWLVVLLERVVTDEVDSTLRGEVIRRHKQQLDTMQLRKLVMRTAPGPWLRLQVATAAEAADLLVAAIGCRGPRLPHPREYL